MECFKSYFWCLQYVFQSRGIDWSNLQFTQTINYPLISIIRLIKGVIRVKIYPNRNFFSYHEENLIPRNIKIRHYCLKSTSKVLGRFLAAWFVWSTIFKIFPPNIGQPYQVWYPCICFRGQGFFINMHYCIIMSNLYVFYKMNPKKIFCCCVKI